MDAGNVQPGQGFQQVHQVPVELQPAVGGQGQGPPDAPFRQPGQFGHVFGAQTGPVFGDQRHHHVVCEGFEDQPAAARADGRQQAARDMADQQQYGAPGRFLQDLEHGVGGVAVHLVGAVDDDDAPAPLGGGQAEEGADGAHVVDHDLGAQPPLLFVPAPLHGQQVGMAAGGGAAKHR